MAGFIRNLKNPFTGKFIFPVTKTRAVYDDKGNRLDNYLNSLYGSPSSNILINSNFANPVNQRGENEKLRNGYWIDRWMIKMDSESYTFGKAVLGNGFISVSKNGGRHMCIRQTVEFPNSYKGATLTASFKYRLKKGSVSAYITWESSGGSDRSIFNDTNADSKWKIGKITLNIPTNLTVLRFDIGCGLLTDSWDYESGECLVDIEWIKIEHGNVATPYVPRLYAEELQLCKRYYQIRSTSTVPEVDLVPNMRTTPTVVAFGSNYSYDAEL